jgi:hypothetical protein
MHSQLGHSLTDFADLALFGYFEIPLGLKKGFEQI